jgi:hypothetical protein
VPSQTERHLTLWDIPQCANDVGMGRCDDCIERYRRAAMRQRRRIRRRERRAKRRSAFWKRDAERARIWWGKQGCGPDGMPL